MIISETNGGSLPFSEDKQDAILGHLLINDKFFVQCHGKIKSEWFIDDSSQRLFKLKTEFYKGFKRCPSLEELKNNKDILAEDVKTRNRLYAKLDLAKYKTTLFGLDALTPELTDWLHSRMFYNSLLKSRDLYNSDKFKDAYQIVKGMVKEVDDTTFNQDTEIKFDNYKQFADDKKSQYENALTFGNSNVDKLLDPDSTNGALLRGDTTVLIAPSNVGKTTVLVTIARHNVLKGRAVLWITHEGTTIDLQTKMWCSMMNVSKYELFKMIENPENYKKFDECVSWFNNYLTFIPMNKAGLTVEEVESVIRRRQEERISKYGEGYALVVDDYPAKLKTEAGKKGNSVKRNDIEDVYNYFVQLALEYNFHSLLAIQTNRDGSKINSHEKGYEDRLIRMEDVAESFGSMMIATNVISINRDHVAELNDRTTFHICKSRSSIKGWAIACKSKFSNAMTHSPDLPSTWYRTRSTMSEKIDALIEQYKDQPVPNHLWTD